MNRYFSISYNYTTDKYNGFGGINIIISGFPSYSYIRKKIRKELKSEELSLVILSIYEFKTEQDFQEFSNEN